MSIHANCKFNKQTIRALTHVVMFKKSNPTKAIIARLSITALLMAVIALEMILFFDSDMIGLLCASFVLLALQCYLYFLLPTIRYNALKKMQEAENEYIFGDHSLKASTDGEAYSGTSEMAYTMFTRVYETDKYFFLGLANHQFYIVEKSTIEGRSQDEIRALLMTNPNVKYVRCKY